MNCKIFLIWVQYWTLWLSEPLFLPYCYYATCPFFKKWYLSLGVIFKSLKPRPDWSLRDLIKVFRSPFFSNRSPPRGHADAHSYVADGFGVKLSKRSHWVLCIAHAVLVWSNLACLIVHSQREQMNLEIVLVLDPWRPVSWERPKLVTHTLLQHLQWRPERVYCS